MQLTEVKFKIGDYVKPRSEWTVPPFNACDIPSGRITAFGMNGFAAYVNGRAFGTYCFELAEPPADEPPPAVEAPAEEPAPRQYQLQLSRE